VTLIGQLYRAQTSHKSEFLDGKIAANQGMSVNVLLRNKCIRTMFLHLFNVDFVLFITSIRQY